MNLVLRCSHPSIPVPAVFRIERLQLLSDDPLCDVIYYPMSGISGFQLIPSPGQSAIVCEAERLVYNRRTLQWSVWYSVAGGTKSRVRPRLRRPCRELQGCLVTEVLFH